MADYEEEVADYLEEEYNQEECSSHVVPNPDDLVDGTPEEMKKRVEEMEEELARVTQMQQQVADQLSVATDKIDEISV